MPYEPRNFDRLLGLAGFSDALLKNHFTLYQGYVAQTNKLLDAMAALSREGRAASPERAELKRRFGWEFNGMRLHELYFENLSRVPGAPERAPAFFAAATREYGSVDAWTKDFRATASARGIGWVVLYRDPAGERLANCWIDEHDVGHLAGAKPLLVLDVFEHAFMLDYGLKRADYVEAFFRAIDWPVVEARLASPA